MLMSHFIQLKISLIWEYGSTIQGARHMPFLSSGARKGDEAINPLKLCDYHAFITMEDLMVITHHTDRWFAMYLLDTCIKTMNYLCFIQTQFGEGSR